MIKKYWLKVIASIMLVTVPMVAMASDLVDVADLIASGALDTATEIAWSKVWQFVFFFIWISIFVAIIVIITKMVRNKG